ncbi:MAG: FtsX-like permease family protein [Chloroflexi bacterium]|nr:MAG: FtsX-like permease family protein [Chloroflexota bacterium]TMF85195.1 MAG: FtsX-like permease family protein [Chloroflexota bacterium]TMG10223.1 MAG: FtsX-like permease family protein [Chloroflexota bacterium]
MSILQTIETGLRSLLGHRLRSVLTTLGILFGVAAVIATVGIGQASSDSVTARITSLGTNLLTVSPGSTVFGGVFGGGASANSLTMRDVAGLSDRQNAPDISAVAPVSQGRVSLVSTSSNWSTTLSGSTPDWLIANARSMSSGTFITSADVSTSAQVIVLGATTASNLGAGVGDLITVKQIPFQVIGILASTGSQGFGNQDDLAVVPLTTAQDELIGGVGTVQRILLSATSSANLGTAYAEANQILLQTHGITNPSQADFSITSQTQVLSTAQAVTQTLTILLASVAAISLLVGGIGVMNIMLVSVTERTSEIGLRKALGATPGDLFRQFVIEAGALTAVGGLLGVATGLAAGYIVPRTANIAVTITPAPIAIAVAVAVVVGLVFGVYPALRAARLAPIEALRAQ